MEEWEEPHNSHSMFASFNKEPYIRIMVQIIRIDQCGLKGVFRIQTNRAHTLFTKFIHTISATQSSCRKAVRQVRHDTLQYLRMQQGWKQTNGEWRETRGHVLDD